MKYPSDCVYVDKRGAEVPVNTAVDGIIKVLKHKSGKAVIDIKVKRREALYMYVNQIVLGIKANRSKFKGYIDDSVDLEDLVSELINTNIIDITQEYKLATKDKTVIGAYRVELSIENFMLEKLHIYLIM